VINVSGATSSRSDPPLLLGADLGPPVDWTGKDAPLDGVVLIPDYVDPTNPRRIYDLDCSVECRYLYEVVLVDGTAADINRLIAPTILIEVWDRLYLPLAVRAGWTPMVRALEAAEHRESAPVTTATSVAGSPPCPRRHLRHTESSAQPPAAVSRDVAAAHANADDGLFRGRRGAAKSVPVATARTSPIAR
jgi:hypothetical protein